jgi:HIV Tat-specific factor 1
VKLSLHPAALNQHGGYFKSEAVLFWREGQGDWKPLGELSELQQALQQAPPAADAGNTAAPAAAAAATAAAQGGQPPPSGRRGAAAAAAPAVAPDPQLAGFLSEISALEADGDGPGADGGTAAAADADAPASPPPDERRFEDDDGTVYLWDPSLRKFMPEGAAAEVAAAAAAYQEEDMVFVPDEEQLPEYVPPPKVSIFEGVHVCVCLRRKACLTVLVLGWHGFYQILHNGVLDAVAGH